MSLKQKALTGACIIIALSTWQIAWHVLIGWDNAWSRRLLSLYLWTNQDRSYGKPGIATWVDLVIPGMVAGALCGALAKPSKAGELAAFCLPVALTLSLLQIVYIRVGGYDLWWLHSGPRSLPVLLVFNAIVASGFCLCGMLGYYARARMRPLGQKRGAEKGQKRGHVDY